MRQTFDKSVPVHEQLKRIVKSHTGRKHQHRKGPRRSSAELQARRLQAMKVQKSKRAKFLKKARAYWAGESEVHP